MDAPAVADAQAAQASQALAWSFLVRMAMCLVWLAAVVALIAPVRVEVSAGDQKVSIDCGTALGVITGTQDAHPVIGKTPSECTEHAFAQLAGAMLIAVGALMTGRPLVRRLDRLSGIDP